MSCTLPILTEKYAPQNVLFVTHGDVANRYLPEADFMPEYSHLKVCTRPANAHTHTHTQLHECGFVVLKGPHDYRATEEAIADRHRTESM